MTVTDADEASLRRALGELDARLARDTERGPDAYALLQPLVDRLRVPAAAFLRPELEDRLARHVEAGDSFARDRVAHALAGACGAAALPALLRAKATDRNDDGDTLELDLLDLFTAWPEEALRLTLDSAASADPAMRRVGIWGLSVLDFGGAHHFGRIADAASDPDPLVRADAMSTLGTIFGAGNPERARAVLVEGTNDPVPEVRSAAAEALRSWPEGR